MPTPLDPAFNILHVKCATDGAPHRDAFIRAYCEVFAGDPYFEQFTPEEAGAIFDKLTSTPGQITLLAMVGEEVAAFGIAVPLAARPDISRELTGLLPVPHTYYLAELGVVTAHRGYGIGRALVRERMLHMNPATSTHVVLRVSASDEDRSKAMYAGMGFQDMGVYMEVPALRTDGSVRTDRRLFLSRVLSQVAVD